MGDVVSGFWPIRDRRETVGAESLCCLPVEGVVMAWSQIVEKGLLWRKRFFRSMDPNEAL